MARFTLGWQLLALGVLVAVRADPGAPPAAATSLRGSASLEVAGPSTGEPAAAGAAPQVPEEESLDSEGPQNATGVEEAAESLIVCRGAKVCRGRLTWYGGHKTCTGGWYCRGWAAVLLEDAGVQAKDYEDEATPADVVESGAGADGQALGSTELMQVLSNATQSAESLIVCRGAKVCRGGWSWYGARKTCRGGFTCAGR